MSQILDLYVFKDIDHIIHNILIFFFSFFFSISVTDLRGFYRLEQTAVSLLGHRGALAPQIPGFVEANNTTSLSNTEHSHLELKICRFEGQRASVRAQGVLTDCKKHSHGNWNYLDRVMPT